jgi:hypothetical protein
MIIPHACFSGERASFAVLLLVVRQPLAVTELAPVVKSGRYAGKSQLAWSRIEPCGWVCTPALHRALISAAARSKLVVRFDAPVRKHVTS